MKIKSILMPIDFSHSSDAALTFASSLAASSNARLVILHVGEDSPGYLAGYGGLAYTPEIQRETVRENREQLDKIKPTVDGVEFEHQYLDGDPVREILRFAEEENIELIVIGSHGRTGFSRLLLGSVAEAVVSGATCPVLTVKQPTKEGSSESLLEVESESKPYSGGKKNPGPKSNFSLH